LQAKQSANNVFTDFQIVDNPITLNLQSEQSLQLNLGLYGTYNLNLVEQSYYSSNYNRTNASKHYVGEIVDYPNSKVSLTVNENFVLGFIQLEDEKIFIEPAYFYADSDLLDQLIVYNEQDVVPVETKCAQQLLASNQNKISDSQVYNNSMSTCNSYTIEIAMAADYGLYTEYQMNQNTLTNLLESIHNMSQPYYDNEFANNIQLVLVETSIETSANQFNLTNSPDATVFLNDLDTKQVDVWNEFYDIGSFWTSRNIHLLNEYGVAGVAREASLCDSRALTVNETYSSNTASLATVNVHEIGHVLGFQGHDPDGTNYIMSSGGNSGIWSTNSINTINNYLEDKVCQCVNGAYDDLSINCPTISEYSSTTSEFIYLSTNVYNAGNAASEPTTYKAYLSLDETVSSNDIEIFNVNLPSIPANIFAGFSSSWINLTALTADLPNGTYNVISKVAGSNVDPILENNETESCYTFEVNNIEAPFIDNVNVVSNNLEPGDAFSIQWTDNIPDNSYLTIKLYQGNSLVTQISNNTLADGSVTLYLPNWVTSGNNYRVRLMYYSDGNLVADEYSGNFSIESTNFTISNVNVIGDNFISGSDINITWTDDIPNNELLRVALYNGSDFVELLSTTIPANGSTTLTLPNNLDVGNSYNVRVIYVGTSVYDAYSANFSIIEEEEESYITNVTIANDEIYPGSQFTINWEDNIQDDHLLRIALYDGFVFLELLSLTVPATGSATFTFPGNLPIGDNYKVRVIYISDSVYDDYSANFSVIEEEGESYISNVTIATDNVQLGNQITINWEDNIQDDHLLRIALYDGFEFLELLSITAPPTGSATYTFPNNLSVGNNYNIRVIYTYGGSFITDGYSANFAVAEPGTYISNISVVTNNLQPSDQFTFTWDDNIEDDERLYSYLYRGGNYVSYISSIDANGTATKNLPSDLIDGDSYSIRIIYYKGGQYIASAYSPNFSITNGLRLSTEDLPFETLIAPNPIINSGTLNLNITEKQKVDINLFNINGELIKNIAPLASYDAGSHNFELDMSTLPAGIYFCSFIMDENIITKKIIKADK